ncbi:MAG: hypothetical protein ABIH71_00110 [Candidatus Omnitrophota bacterium]|nr:hypothetical protein [Candidatus Omnitrophota bacterium]
MGVDVKCPSCGLRFEMDQGLEIGDTTFCSECYTELRIIKTSPMQVEEILDQDDYDDNADE